MTEPNQAQDKGLMGPEPPQGPAHLGREFVAPRTEVELFIAGVLSEALGQDRIGIHDDFFDLGGQSLQVTKAINKIQLLTGLELDLRKFFMAPTVAGLSGYVIELFAALEESEAGSISLET